MCGRYADVHIGKENNLMQKILMITPGQKYRLALFGILGLSSIISIGLFSLRANKSDSDRYAFLIWNLFLAWIPFGFAWVAYASSRLPKLLRVILVSSSAVLWLLFFPNAPYIMTDFQHLRNFNAEAPIWYDVIMLLWFSWIGLFLGIISLYLMQKIVDRWFGRTASWLFVLAVTILSSLGIYVGRFLRWNSWDVFFKPLKMTGKLLNSFSDSQDRTFVFSFTFALFFLFVYVTIYLFARLINEQNSKN
jgi:uncharacterized membrane protein